MIIYNEFVYQNICYYFYPEIFIINMIVYFTSVLGLQ